MRKPNTNESLRGTQLHSYRSMASSWDDISVNLTSSMASIGSAHHDFLDWLDTTMGSSHL
jgi:hypothetical protein